MNDEEILWQIYREARRRNPQEGVAITVSYSHLRSVLRTHDRLIHIDWLIYSNNRRLKMLDRAFPSCPGHPGKYDLRVQRDDGTFHYHVFASIYPARKMYDILIGDRRTSWITRTSQRCHDLTITSKYLERIVTHEYTEDEAKWLLPLPYSHYAKSIAFNETYTGAPAGEVKSTGGDPAATSSGSKTGRTLRSEARKARRAARSTELDTALEALLPVAKQKPVQPKRESTFEYGIPQLAAATGKDPSKVRAILRAKVPKPVEGWVWDEAGYNQVLKIIR